MTEPSDNVVALPKRMQCARCKQTIQSGEEYAMVRTPTGEVPIHGKCLRPGSPEVP